MGLEEHAEYFSREQKGGDDTYTERGFWSVSAIWKVRVIGQMRVQAKLRMSLHMCVCMCVCIKEKVLKKRSSGGTNDEEWR